MNYVVIYNIRKIVKVIVYTSFYKSKKYIWDNFTKGGI